MNSDIRERAVSRVKENLRGGANEDGTVTAIEELRESCDDEREVEVGVGKE